MKCPRCGHEMETDTHRKIPFMMCYECGYMEGRNLGPLTTSGETNFERMKKLNYNELVSFLSRGLGVDSDRLADWLNNTAE